MLKKLALVFVLLGAILAGGVGWAYLQVKASIDQPVAQLEEPYLTVRPGTTFRGLIYQLTQMGVIAESPWTRWVGRIDPTLARIKAGTYSIERARTLKDVLVTVASGKEYQFSITLLEGDRFTDWLNELENAPMLKHETAQMTEADIAKAIGADVEKLEGYLLPETYHYTAGTSDLALLKRAYGHMTQLLGSAWEDRDASIPLKNPYEVLIMASIIEKETAVDEERAKVSSVFMNRLHKGMRLQTDPTVIYGMGDKFDGNIRRKDLRTPTPYNTYTIFGLPPTPIAMPSAASVLAAVKPAQTNYYYFVADGKGGHTFSKTLSEHNRAVRQYLKILKQ
ncbi:endolytic transglycosylase MltG [Photobacterium sp. 1_MG-2023]|uniref:endolytic transglycosylase MltG n=1 Tax=Photobacterium sp. 1_MG-2023 TaxID=3062646 RepID=UPI0026E1B1DB|nr:endolytic transglycosylase MltG [Photobacterium sp. 1_MG-2023]MDO6705747.1 endolytic transglycosylase MltG [Photobacterium sp. 1_MG-2023]